MTRATIPTEAIERITSAIRDIFAVFDDPPEDDIARLQRDFVAVINGTNARLKECDDLLRRGLRQEAISECEEAPPLLDLVAQLDIPEWHAWADYVVQFGLPPQPALLVDVAAELNEAYAAAQSLDGLLRKHRLLALARSPLADRLGLLRTIAERDPKNPAWQADLQSYEAVRHKELRSQVDSLVTQGDLGGLATLRRELEGSRWIVAPPASLVEEARTAHQRLVAIDARGRLAQLEPAINSAFGAFELGSMAPIRKQWDAAWGLAGLPAEHPLAQRVRPAFAWHDEEIASERLRQQHEREVGLLEAALDDDRTTQSDLERLHASLARYDEPILPRLQRRYEERIRSLELSHVRRGRLRLVSIVAAILVVGTIVGVLMLRQHRQSEIATAATALERFLADKRPGDAMAYWQDLGKSNPKIAEAPQLRAVLADIQSQLKLEADRKDDLADLVKQIDAVDYASSWDALGTARRLLDKAKKLAVGEDELVPLLTIEQRMTDATIALQRTTDEQFQRDVAAFRARVASETSASEINTAALLREGSTLSTRPHVSRATMSGSGIDIVVAQLKTRLSDAERRREQDAALKRLVAAVGDGQRYKVALEGYIREYPGAVRSSEFQGVMDSLDLLDAQTTWNGLAAEWNSHTLRTPADAEAILDVIARAKDYGLFPQAAEAFALKPYAESVKAREKGDGSELLGDLREILKDDIFNMNRLRVGAAGTFYYFFGDETRNQGRLTITSLMDSRDPNVTDEKGFKEAEVTAVGPSPQKAFAEKAHKALTNAQFTYEYAVCAVLHFLESDREMDPILKCRLLTIFYDRAAPGSSILAEELRRFRSQIEPPYALEDQNFIAVDDPQVTKIRANVTELLGRVPDTDKPKAVYVKRIGPRIAAITETPTRFPSMEWIGILMRTEGQTWQVLGVGSPVSDNQSLAIIMRDAAGTMRVRNIGSVSGMTARLDTASTTSFREGQPVFLLNLAK